MTSTLLSSLSISNVCIASLILLNIFQHNVLVIQAGNCFNHRTNDLCYELIDMNKNEDQCTGAFYSDDNLQDLDGYIYAERCRNVNRSFHSLERCDADCGLGQECRWIGGEEMCICSEESCQEANLRNEPVCASNNMTFASKCAMEAWKCSNSQSGLYIKYHGQCQKDCRNVQCPTNKICLLVKNTGEPMCYPRNYCDASLDPEPVCGTNGRTYPNICAMRLSVNRYGRTPELAHKGPCVNECRSDLCQTHKICVYSKSQRPTCIQCDYSPSFFPYSGECSTNVSVCGDNGKLYKNYCSLLIDQCVRKQYVNIIDYGSCPKRKRKEVIRNKFYSMNQLKSL